MELLCSQMNQSLPLQSDLPWCCCARTRQTPSLRWPTSPSPLSHVCLLSLAEEGSRLTVCFLLCYFFSCVMHCEFSVGITLQGFSSFRDNPALFSLLLLLVVSPNHGRAHTWLSSRWVVFFWERTWPPYLNQLQDATCVTLKSPYVVLGPPWLWWGRLLGGSWAHGQPFMTPQVLSPKGPGLVVVISGHRHCNYAEAQKLQRKHIGARKLLQRNKFPATNQWTNVKDYWNQIHIMIQISGLQDNQCCPWTHSMNERLFNRLYFGRRWTERTVVLLDLRCCERIHSGVCERRSLTFFIMN